MIRMFDVKAIPYIRSRSSMGLCILIMGEVRCEPRLDLHHAESINNSSVGILEDMLRNLNLNASRFHTQVNRERDLVTKFGKAAVGTERSSNNEMDNPSELRNEVADLADVAPVVVQPITTCLACLRGVRVQLRDVGVEQHYPTATK